MRVRIICCFIFLAIFVSRVNADQKGPVVISPGIETGVAVVGQSCPTFSWTSVEWATGYKVVIFETNGPNVLRYEEMAAISSPLLSKEIQGLALSWTPSSEERLSNGGMYVWYVQAVDTYGQGIWSEGRMFKVEVEVQLVGMEDSIRKSLREKGMSEEAIEDVLEDMRLGRKEVVAYGVDREGNESKTQDKIGIQGLEGTTNTFYGLDAGFSIAPGGDYNSFFGRAAGFYNTTGSSNIFMGWRSGYSNTTGNANTFIGNGAGRNNTIGINNTFLGSLAGYSNTTANSNTSLGAYAGYNNITGQGNVFLGYQAGWNESGSNRLYIDNSSTSSPLIYGEFDNDILAINGKLGIGTHSPGYPMHLRTNGTNSAFVADRQDGATNYINATSGFGNFGTVNDYPLRLVVNGLWKMRLDSDQSLTMANGATCTSGGVWTDASSRELKENIHCLTTEEAVDALKALNPVKYNYKTDKDEGCVGFIAEEVPDLVASKDRKGMSPMDVVAVLTKVVQEQQETVKEQKKVSQEQQETIDELRKEIEELKKKHK